MSCVIVQKKELDAMSADITIKASKSITSSECSTKSLQDATSYFQAALQAVLSAHEGFNDHFNAIDAELAKINTRVPPNGDDLGHLKIELKKQQLEINFLVQRLANIGVCRILMLSIY